jgi:hypothetical protein
LDGYKVLAVAVQEMHKLRDERMTFISSGRASNYDEYRHVCGVILGLSLAENTINDLVQKAEYNDE